MKKILLIRNYETGMTLVEITFIVFIMGIIATMSAGNWLNFLNQQKLNKLNETVELSIREGQDKAKTENTSYTVEFRLNSNNKLEYRSYSGLFSALNNTSWKSISDQPESMTVPLSQGSSITFNNNGTINSGSALKTNEKIVLSLPNFSPPSKRCVIVQTLLGSLTTGKNTECQ